MIFYRRIINKKNKEKERSNRKQKVPCYYYIYAPGLLHNNCPIYECLNLVWINIGNETERKGQDPEIDLEIDLETEKIEEENERETGCNVFRPMITFVVIKTKI